MAFENLYKPEDRKSRREQVYERLMEALAAPETHAGKRLAPVKDLAAQFGTSVRTVQLAIEQLESEGRVQRRHGVGTFVRPQAPVGAVTRHVAVVLPMQEEVWTILASHLIRDLQADGHLTISIDANQADAVPLLQRAAEERVGTFIIHGGRGFPHHLLQQPAFRDKQFIAIEEWASTFMPPRMHQVLHDYAYGGQQLAEYLFSRGHRRAIIVAAPDSLARLTRRDGIVCGAARGHAFIDAWTAHGGTWIGLPSRRATESLSDVDIDVDALVAALAPPATVPASNPASTPATAIFGYRDVEAWTVQSLLQSHRPDLLQRTGPEGTSVEIVGYGDTFWSRAARPPLTTIAYPVQDMAQRVRQLLDASPSHGRGMHSQCIMVRPYLVDRSRRQPPRP